MRCLAHIALVTVIQFIACYLVGWGRPKQFYAVLHSAMAGTVYMVVLSNTKKTECVG
ncbi:Conjugal transfer protein TraS (fragment) (plasmid) [Escherichia coli]